MSYGVEWLVVWRGVRYASKGIVEIDINNIQAKTIVGPLDRVKILFQTGSPHYARYTTGWFGVVQALQHINNNEGARGLFKGHSATLLRIFPYAAIKFLAYEQIRSSVIPTKDHETHFRRLISGSLAGLTSVFVTYPLEVIRVRLAFETKHGVPSSLRRICRQIFFEHHHHLSSPHPHHLPRPVAAAEAVTVPLSVGLANFYRGFTPTVLGMFPYAGISFLTHDTLGDWLRSPTLAPYTTVSRTAAEERAADEIAAQSGVGSHQLARPRLTAGAELFSGAVSGLVSQTSSYPLEVIRRRMQVGGAVGDGHMLNIRGTVARLYQERGLRGFWVGLTIGYLKVVPMVATGFFVYERAKWYLGI